VGGALLLVLVRAVCVCVEVDGEVDASLSQSDVLLSHRCKLVT